MKAIPAVFLLIWCLSVAGCTGNVEPTDLSVLELGASRDQVEATLGHPIKVRSDNEMEVATYGYNRGMRGVSSDRAFILGVLSVVAIEQIIEAERLVVEWQPNPTECEAIFRQLEKYAQSVGARHEQLEALARLGNAAALYRHAYSLNDFSQSWKWYCLAANQGHGIASYAVGNFYPSGLGPVKQDRIKAYVWYTLAGDAGTARSVGAAPSKDKLASEMTPSQIAEAERLVAEWEPNPAECEAIAAQIEN